MVYVRKKEVMTKSKRIAAFFDIDGTLYREGLITEVFKKLITHEIVDHSYWQDDVKDAYTAWDHRVGEYDEYLKRMVSVYVEAIKGIHQTHIKLIADKVIKQKGDRVYVFTRDRIFYHQKSNHLVVAVSGSPEELVKTMAEKYHFDDYRATVYQTKDKHYTGEVSPMWDSYSKCKAIEELTDKYKLDLENSYAYGDTDGDYMMLKMVGHPFAINPTKSLLNKIIADPELKSKVTIIVERKDSIYCLDIDKLNLLSI